MIFPSLLNVWTISGTRKLRWHPRNYGTRCECADYYCNLLGMKVLWSFPCWTSFKRCWNHRYYFTIDSITRMNMTKKKYLVTSVCISLSFCKVFIFVSFYFGFYRTSLVISCNHLYNYNNYINRWTFLFINNYCYYH